MYFRVTWPLQPALFAVPGLRWYDGARRSAHPAACGARPPALPLVDGGTNFVPSGSLFVHYFWQVFLCLLRIVFTRKQNSREKNSEKHVCAYCKGFATARLRLKACTHTFVRHSLMWLLNIMKRKKVTPALSKLGQVSLDFRFGWPARAAR